MKYIIGLQAAGKVAQSRFPGCHYAAPIIDSFGGFHPPPGALEPGRLISIKLDGNRTTIIQNSF